MRTIQIDGQVFIVHEPGLAGHNHVAVTAVVADGSAFALVHLPVSYEMTGCRVLGLGAVKQGSTHVMSLVPQKEFVD